MSQPEEMETGDDLSEVGWKLICYFDLRKRRNNIVNVFDYIN